MERELVDSGGIGSRMEKRRPKDEYECSRENVKSHIHHKIVWIDEIINEQISEITQHPEFKALESLWRAIRFLAWQNENLRKVKLKILDVSWQELSKDLDKAIEFDQSAVFQKVYQDEFGMAGGEPFSVLIGDYYVKHKLGDEGVDDIRTLSRMSQVAAASFAPFIVNADPGLFELESYAKMPSSLNIERTFQQKSYIKWKAFRESDDSRFIGITLPRVLVKEPHNPLSLRSDGFLYHEKTVGSEKNYSWIGSNFLFGTVLARNYLESGWLSSITGIGALGSGITSGIVRKSSPVDSRYRMTSEVIISDRLERTFSENGFIPLSSTTNSDVGAFYSASSAQKAMKYQSESAQENSQIAAKLSYVFCTSRFAHYLKVIIREKIGSFTSANQCRDYLQKWIMDYVTSVDEDDELLRSKYPLRSAKVYVNEKAGLDGVYNCTVYLTPHMQLESIETSLQFVAEVVPNRMAS